MAALAADLGVRQTAAETTPVIMTTFDRVAWACSWLAPLGWLLALAAFLLGLVVGRPAAAASAGSASLPVVALAAASLVLNAHTILRSHALRARAFTPEERTG